MPTRLHRARRWPRRVSLFALAVPTALLGQGRSATVNGETLYYEIAGEGPALVLIHGWSLNLRMWDAQVPALGKQFRVIRYDRRGFGKSTGNEDLSWDAADLSALLDQLGVTTAHLLGMSQGGRVALQFARDHPERVSSLILHGTSAPDGFGLTWSGADRPRFNEWGVRARDKGLDAFRREWATHPLMEIPATRPEARKRLGEILAAYNGGRFLRPAPPSGPVKPIAMEDVLKLRVPTLVVNGEREAPFLQIVARALAYYIPDARRVEVPGGGHLVNMIEPARYNAAILAFLSDVDRRKK